MKKSILTILFGAALTAGAQTQTAYYYEDFQSGTPDDMTFLDEDHLTINNNLIGSGLESGTWHILQMTSGDTNYFMGSTSMFSVPGKANDWMITPKMKIYGEGAKLTWKGIVCDNSLKCDGYKVYVSTKGNSPADFDAEPVFSIDAENSAKWVTHSVSLDKYAGKQIYIAFVNDSYDKYVLGIDDIMVLGPSPKVDFSITTPRMTATGKTRITARITNTYGEPLNDITLKYAVGTDTVSQDFTGLNLVSGASADITMDKEIGIEINNTLRYDAWVSLAGDDYLSVRDSVMSVYFVSNRKTLIEEGTGLWCGNCPLGTATIEYMEKWYGDNVISIAIHDNSSGGDPMGLPSYLSAVGLSQYPTGLIDRKFLAGPCGSSTDKNGNYSMMNAGFEHFYKEAQKQSALAEINGRAIFANEEKTGVQVVLETKFVKDLTDKSYQIALIVVEDSVTAANGDLYLQHNYFSSPLYEGKCIYGEKDTLENIAGYYGKGEYVSQKCNHVARGAYGNSYSGQDPQFPAEIKGNTVYANPLAFTLGQGLVNNPDNTHLVAILIDANTSWIENACKIAIEPTSGIEGTVASSDSDINVDVNGNKITLSAIAAGNMSVSVYSADGALIDTQSAAGTSSHTFVMPRNMKGVYVVKATAGKATVTRKVVF